MAFSIAVAPFVLVMPDEFKEFGKEVARRRADGRQPSLPDPAGLFRRRRRTPRCCCICGRWRSRSNSISSRRCSWRGLWWLPGLARAAGIAVAAALLGSRSRVRGSLAGCICFTQRRPQLCLLSGGAEGVGIHRRRRDRLLAAVRQPPAAPALEWLAAAGLAAIVVAALLYQADTPYPSWRAALPVFGAAAVICAGIADPKSPVSAPARRAADGVDRPRLLFLVSLALAAARAVADPQFRGAQLRVRSAGWRCFARSRRRHPLLVERPIRRWYRLRTNAWAGGRCWRACSWR